MDYFFVEDSQISFVCVKAQPGGIRKKDGNFILGMVRAICGILCAK